MSSSQILNIIRESGVIAIIRAQSSHHLLQAADAIREGGGRAMEVTMTTPGALDVIAAAAARYGQDVLFGAGSVLDSETARAAILAGAAFIVCPTLNLDVITLCKRYSVPVMPGCLSPTEVLTAWEAGADLIKLFPASIGGPSYVKAIRAPLPHIDLVPVGGVTLDNTAAFIQAGAVAVGVGGHLINQTLLESGDLAEIRRRMAAFVAAVQEGRRS